MSISVNYNTTPIANSQSALIVLAPGYWVLGIDEHFFTRKKGFATTFVDLEKHHVFDVKLGRSESSLRSYLSALPNRNNVEVMVGLIGNLSKHC